MNRHHVYHPLKYCIEVLHQYLNAGYSEQAGKKEKTRTRETLNKGLEKKWKRRKEHVVKMGGGVGVLGETKVLNN